MHRICDTKLLVSYSGFDSLLANLKNVFALLKLPPSDRSPALEVSFSEVSAPRRLQGFLPLKT